MRIRFQRLAVCMFAGSILAGAASQPPSEPRHVERSVAIELADPDAASAPTIIDATRRSLARYAEWLGAFPGERITIGDVPWLIARRDPSLDRAIDAVVARQYALSLDVASSDAWFADGLAAFLSTRAADDRIELRPYLVMHFFGGYVPHAIRLSAAAPANPLPRISAIGAYGRARRLAVALHTLERFAGWPAVQPALAALFQQHNGGTAPLETLSAIVSRQRGVDMSWFFGQAMRTDATFDYALARFDTAPTPAGWQTTVDVRRLGDATFDGTSLPRSVSTARSLPVVVRFADGSEMREWIDGRDREWQYQYTSASAGTLASVDPDAILLLDADRTNNTRTVNPPVHDVGRRLAFNWLAWLQDAMLACTAVL